VIGVLASTIGLVYYLRLTAIMFFNEPAPALDKGHGFGSTAIMVVSGAVTLVLLVAPSPLINAADAAAKALLP
jgi:NADH-quinone oxidoreductase subunit N